MRKKLIIAAIGIAIAGSSVHAQTELKAYADANGYIDVQKSDLRAACRNVSRGRGYARCMVQRLV